jgi:hypothetical protein
MDDVSDAAVAQARIEELTRERGEARARLRTALYFAGEAARQWEEWHSGEQERQGMLSEELIESMWALVRAVTTRLPRREDVPCPELRARLPEPAPPLSGDGWRVMPGSGHCLTAQEYAAHYFGCTHE